MIFSLSPVDIETKSSRDASAKKNCYPSLISPCHSGIERSRASSRVFFSIRDLAYIIRTHFIRNPLLLQPATPEKYSWKPVGRFQRLQLSAFTQISVMQKRASFGAMTQKNERKREGIWTLLFLLWQQKYESGLITVLGKKCMSYFATSQTRLRAVFPQRLYFTIICLSLAKPGDI